MTATVVPPPVRPFQLAIPQQRIDELHRRLDQVRWPERETVDDRSQGVPLAEMQELADYWRSGYDWRRCEDRLNGLGQFLVELGGLDIHFLHVRSPVEDALPLLITHGWPGSVIEFMAVIEPLTDPERYGGKAEDAFHIVAPSLPGFGFSARPGSTGWGIERIARAWAELMQRLGYPHWVAQGGDWGAGVTSRIGEHAPAGCRGIHLNMPLAMPPPEALSNPTEQDREALQRLKRFDEWESGYVRQQGTRPQTLGYGLLDSPVALAAWVYEKLQSWSDNSGSVQALLGRDAILDNIMLYWLPGTGASAARLYWERERHMQPGTVNLPAGFSILPREHMRVPRSWVEPNMPNIIHWNELDKGGHFAAWEQPDLFVGELRQCFAKLR